MCGFCGILNLNKSRVDQDQLQVMTDRMSFRGPDSEGFYFKDNIGLGFRRLAIIDLTSGNQPISNEDGSIMLVMNGEIYNYIELRTKLKEKGHKFKTSGDAEVILHLYEEYGVNLVDYLNGMFAFALYDTVNKKTILGRDRLGIKPLYFTQKNNQILFGSDARSVAGIGKPSISESAFLSFLAFGYTNNDSIFSGVSKLKPGHILEIKEGSISVSPFWKLENFGDNLLSDAGAEKKLFSLLKDSVNLQLRSDVPLGIFLSGGVDSSAIVALASGISDSPINTYSVEYIGKNGSDPIFASEVSNKYNTYHKRLKIGPEEVESYLDDLLYYLDEPIADSAIIATYALSKKAKQDGIKVLLSGAGGDEIFGGYNRHMRPKTLSRNWIRDSILFNKNDFLIKILKKFNPSLYFRFGDECLNYAAQISGVDYSFIHKLLNNNSQYNRLIEIVKHEYQSIQTHEDEIGYKYARMFNDLNGYLVNNILSLTDKATMAASIEARVPLLDHRLVEYAFSLPHHVNILNGKSKGLFKKSLEDVLNKKILYRTKEGFNAPVKHWVSGQSGHIMKENLLDHTSEILTDFIDMTEVEKMFAKENLDKRVFETIFSLYVFNKWWNLNYS